MPHPKISTNDILRRAWVAFHLHGYQGTSLQRIGEETGLTKAGLLHHYPSKRQLMLAVLDFATAWHRRKVLSILSTDAPPADRLRAFLEKHMELVRMDDRGCFFANIILETSRDEQFTEPILAFYEAWTTAVRDFLAEWLPAEEADRRAHRLFTEYEGTVMVYRLRRDPAILHQLVATAIAELVLPHNTSPRA